MKLKIRLAHTNAGLSTTWFGVYACQARTVQCRAGCETAGCLFGCGGSKIGPQPFADRCDGGGGVTFFSSGGAAKCVCLPACHFVSSCCSFLRLDFERSLKNLVASSALALKRERERHGDTVPVAAQSQHSSVSGLLVVYRRRRADGSPRLVRPKHKDIYTGRYRSLAW